MSPLPPPPPALASPSRSIAGALCGKAASRGSGILTATRGKLRRLFCLDSGRLVFAASNLVEEQFPEFLVRHGVIGAAERAAALEASQRGGRRFTQVLLEQGAVHGPGLRRGMEGLVEELLTSTLEWPDGAATFADGKPKVDDEVAVRLSPLLLVLAHARRYPASLDAVRIRIGRPDLRPERSEDVEDRLAGLELDGTAGWLLDRCDGRADLGGLLARSPSPEPDTLRALYGLLLAGVLVPAEARRGTARRGARDAAVSREECLARLHLAAAGDPYRTLGIERDATRQQVRDAYYALARRLHPDRFRSGDLQDLLPKIEEFFSRVTEAYNTLYDPDRRAEYDQASTVAQPEAGRQTEPAYLARQNFLRGRALAEKRRFNDAVTFLENAVQLDDNQGDFHIELGLVLARNPRRRDDAERHLLRGVEISPASPKAYFALGQLFQRSGRAEDAARMYRETLRWDDRHKEAAEALAALGPAARS